MAIFMFVFRDSKSVFNAVEKYFLHINTLKPTGFVKFRIWIFLNNSTLKIISVHLETSTFIKNM